MSADSEDTVRWRLLLPRFARRLPADLVAVLGLVAAATLVTLTPGIRATPLRFVAAPVALFAPGYALVAALFPGANDRSRRDRGSGGTDAEVGTAEEAESDARGRDGPVADRSVALPESGVGWVERLSFSVAASVAVVALVALALDGGPWDIRAASVVVGLDAFVLAATGIAAVRRWSLPADARFAVPYDRWASDVRAGLFEADGRRETAVNVALAATLLLATASVTYAVAVPRAGESYTELALLTENETGELVVADYPGDFDAERFDSLRVSVTNRESRSMDYVVVTERLRAPDATDSGGAGDRRELGRTRVSLAPGESWVGEPDGTASLSGDDVALGVFLYRGDAPAQASNATAYRSVRWVDESATTASVGGNASDSAD